ncbi:NADPH:quinone oxidoreductase family protein [Acaryochloris marina NIES-2412]|uniref:NADPH:quinone oxidoreductase family protein n=1 Tax=Acaryochloris marina TaxID=155978 RepID=UPI00405880B9
MKAFQVQTFDDASSMQVNEVADLQPAAHQVVIQVQAAGVNPADWYVIHGSFQLPPALPATPGFEAAGVILAVGAGVTGVAVGDRVLAVLPYLNQGTATFGAFAEQAVVPAAHILPLPENIEFATAAAIPVMYGTAHIALTHRAQLQPGETLLVTGASGTTGSAAVQIGKRLGATVIATASGPEKIARVQQLGADVVIDYRQDHVAQRLQNITGTKGVDVVFETVGGDLFQAILTAIAPEGRLLPIGAASGVIPDVSIMTLLAGNFALMGTDFAYYTLKRTNVVQQSLSTLLGWSSDGFFDAINPQTATLEQAVDVIEQVHQGAGARWVLLP